MELAEPTDTQIPTSNRIPTHTQGTSNGNPGPRDANQRQRGLKHTVGFEAHGRFKIMGFNCLVKLETHSGTGWWKRAKMIARPNAQISGQSAKLTPPGFFNFFFRPRIWTLQVLKRTNLQKKYFVLSS